MNAKTLTVGALVIILVATVGAILVQSGRFDRTPQNTAVNTQEPATTTSHTTSPNVRLTTPQPNATIMSPLVITGEAKGWMFEASFPVELRDGNGKIIAQGPAQALSDWITSDFVPFRAELKFTKPSTQTGTLILRKDNPSGLPEHDESVSILVRFGA